jgi:hypothetical protein
VTTPMPDLAPPPAPRPSPHPLPAPSDPKARLHAPPSEEKKLDERLPDPAIDWLVIGRPAPGATLKRPAILGAFEPAWRRSHDVVRLYGWHGNQATLIESDSAESYDQVAAAMSLVVAVGDDDLRVCGASTLAGFRDDVKKRLAGAGAADLQVPVTPEDGTAQARKLQQLFVANGAEIQIRLLAPGVQLFDGPKLLDVLVSLGLPPDEKGAIEFAGFEVKTKSPPGFLDARALAENRLKANNLVFELYVPNAQDPVLAFDLMARAQAYAQKRLGGLTEVVIENFGAPRKSDLKAARKRVAEVQSNLQKAGLPAGSPTTLRLFHMP